MVLGCAVAAIVLATGQRGTALRAVLRPILTVGGAWVLFGLLDLYTVRVIGPFNGWLLARLSGFPDLESAEPTMSVWFEAAGYFPLDQRGVTLRTGPWLSTAPPPGVPTHQLRTNRRDH